LAGESIRESKAVSPRRQWFTEEGATSLRSRLLPVIGDHSPDHSRQMIDVLVEKLLDARQERGVRDRERVDAVLESWPLTARNAFSARA
jgi:hypothetical protein